MLMAELPPEVWELIAKALAEDTRKAAGVQTHNIVRSRIAKGGDGFLEDGEKNGNFAIEEGDEERESEKECERILGLRESLSLWMWNRRIAMSLAGHHGGDLAGRPTLLHPLRLDQRRRIPSIATFSTRPISFTT
jgi:hypothetical protein